MHSHPTSNESEEIRQVPAGAIKFSNADGPPLKILGYIRFHLALGDVTLPVDVLVLPPSGPNKMSLDDIASWEPLGLCFPGTRTILPSISGKMFEKSLYSATK